MVKKSATSRPRGAAGCVLNVSIQSRAVLGACAMPAVQGGGLFVPTDTPFELNDRVCLAVSLMNQPVIPVMGHVIWITPEGAVGHRTQGVGVQIDQDDNGRRLREAIALLMPDETPDDAGHLRSHTF